MRAWKTVQRSKATMFVDDNRPNGPQGMAAAIQRKSLLTAVASYADGDGTNAYMSRQTLADETGFSVRSVDSGLDWLLKKGFLQKSYKSGRASHGAATNTYSVRLTAFEDPADLDSHPAIRLQGELEHYPAVSEQDPAILKQDPANSSGDPAIRLHTTALDRPSKPPIHQSAPRGLVSFQEQTRQGLEWLEEKMMDLSKGAIDFDPKHLAILGTVMSEDSLTKEEMLSGFKIWWEEYDLDQPGNRNYAARNYTAVAKSKARYVRRRKEESTKQEARLEAARARLQAEGEREMEEVRQRRAAEEALREKEAAEFEREFNVN